MPSTVSSFCMFQNYTDHQMGPMAMYKDDFMVFSLNNLFVHVGVTKIVMVQKCFRRRREYGMGYFLPKWEIPSNLTKARSKHLAL